MFEPRFTTLNMNEILKYLGFRGQELTEEIAAQIKRCTDEVLAAATPRLTYRQAPLVDGAVLGLHLWAGISRRCSHHARRLCSSEQRSAPVSSG